VLAQGREIGQPHIAFLRAWFQGIDLHQAWQRYVAVAGEPADMRVIEHTRRRLLNNLLAAGREADLSHPHLDLGRALDVLSRECQTTGVAPIPSLDEWIASEDIDPEFSEAELLEMYREHHGLDSVPDEAGTPADVNEQLRALNVVADVLTQAPAPDDRLALWLAPALAQALEAAGTPTVAALAARVERAPRNWHCGVPGLGAQRARSIRDWLEGLAVSGASRRAPLAAASSVRVSDPAFPMLESGAAEAIAAGSGLSAAQVRLDLLALHSWLERQAGTDHTRRAYRKDVERFYFWVVRAQRKSLAALGPEDGEAYRRFLSDLPAEWIQPLPVPRGHAQWRPFRCALGASSQRQALVVVRLFCAGLVEAAVVGANPMGARRLDVVRAVAAPGLPAQCIRRLMDAGVSGRPLHAGRRALLLQLAAAVPLKLTELSRLQRRALSSVGSDGWQLTMERRGRRLVFPVPAALGAALERHHAEARAAGYPSHDDTPLIWALAGANKKATGMSAAGMHQCLKRLALRADPAPASGYCRFSRRQLRQDTLEESLENPGAS
jgi:site-specific recombinase XerD